jgi:hypothetical protein
LLPRLAIPAFIGESIGMEPPEPVRFIDFFFMRFMEKTFPFQVKSEGTGEVEWRLPPLREKLTLSLAHGDIALPTSFGHGRRGYRFLPPFLWRPPLRRFATSFSSNIDFVLLSALKTKSPNARESIGACPSDVGLS